MTPGDLIFPSRRAHEYTHTHARKRARAYKGSVRRIARGDLVTRCGEVHAETGDPRRHTAVSIHGSLEAERYPRPTFANRWGRPLRPWWERRKERRKARSPASQNRPSSGGIGLLRKVENCKGCPSRGEEF